MSRYFNEVLRLGRERLTGLDAASLHGDGVRFGFRDGAVAHVLGSDGGIRVEYVKTPVYLVYDNMDGMRPKHAISVLKNLVNTATVGQYKEEE